MGHITRSMWNNIGSLFPSKNNWGPCVMLVYKASEQQYCVSADRQTA